MVPDPFESIGGSRRVTKGIGDRIDLLDCLSCIFPIFSNGLSGISGYNRLMKKVTLRIGVDE